MNENRHPRIRVGAIIADGAKLLLVRHEKEGRSYWMPPGGGVEWGESLDAALRRELFEETGLEIEVGSLLAVKDSIAPGDARHIVHLLFRCTVTDGALRHSQDPRVAMVAWVPVTDLTPDDFFPDILPHLVALVSDSDYTGAPYLGNSWRP